MWTTFMTTMRTQLREKSALFWLFAFPIIMATLFHGLFANLSEAYTIQTLNVATVENEAWCTSGAHELIDQLQRTDDASRAPSLCATTSDAATALESSDAVAATSADDTATVGMLEVTPVHTVAQAKDLVLDANNSLDGYLAVNDDGYIALALSPQTASNANDATSTLGINVTISVLNTVLDIANRNMTIVRTLALEHPQALANSALQQALASQTDGTRTITLTHFQPSEACRYYFALLGMASLLAMTFAITAVTSTQANLSALGARRSLSPLPKLKQLTAGFLASWLCACMSLTLAALYMRFCCGISFGGRGFATFIAIAVASLTTSAIGTFIGALPKIPAAAKSGIATGLACTLSLFSGLYGDGAMALSDWISQHAPVFSTINPAQQITNLFYDVLYFDSYVPFMRTMLVLLAMCAMCLLGATALLRRQRYDYL